MSEFLQKVSEGVVGEDDAPEQGLPGTNPPQEPQPGALPGAGTPPQSERPAGKEGEPSDGTSTDPLDRA
jgi:hypothetical protein